MQSTSIAAGISEPEITEALSGGRASQQNEGKTTILIAARAGSHRATLAAFLSDRGHDVVFADNHADVMSLAAKGAIDMVITGHTMPGIDGYALTRDLRAAAPLLPVILMSAGGPVLDGGLLDCVTGLGDLSLEERPGETGEANPAAEILARLTPREREVLDLVANGHANKAVARLLAISPRTVENHRAQIMRKTNSRCVADLVRLSLAAGKATMSAVTGVA